MAPCLASTHGATARGTGWSPQHSTPPYCDTTLRSVAIFISFLSLEDASETTFSHSDTVIRSENPLLSFFTRFAMLSEMELLTATLPYLQIALSLLLIAGILLQQRGATLGGAFGADNFSSTFNQRRGAEKFIFNATAVVTILFIVVALLRLFLH